MIVFGAIPVVLAVAVTVTFLLPATAIAAGATGQACPQPAPEPSNWTECRLQPGSTGGMRARVLYGCDNNTGTYVTGLEKEECRPPYELLPAYYVLAGLAAAIAGTAGLVVWREKFK